MIMPKTGKDQEANELPQQHEREKKHIKKEEKQKKASENKTKQIVHHEDTYARTQ